MVKIIRLIRRKEDITPDTFENCDQVVAMTSHLKLEDIKEPLERTLTLLATFGREYNMFYPGWSGGMNYIDFRKIPEKVG